MINIINLFLMKILGLFQKYLKNIIKANLFILFFILK